MTRGTTKTTAPERFAEATPSFKMRRRRSSVRNPALLASAASVGPPTWAIAWAGGGPPDVRDEAGLTLAVVTGAHATLVSVTVPGIRNQAECFGPQVARAYAAVRASVAASPHACLVRLWNHVPGIHDAMDGGGDRYMAFNAARYAAMLDWYGSVVALRAAVPAATGVGHDGDALVVHALATAVPGRVVENPRQVPATQYSAKFGPRPPCFARGTVVADATARPTLLVAGTAAITGEESQFPGDLPRQFRLACENIAAVIERAALVSQGATSAVSPSLSSTLRHVRVYLPPSVMSSDFDLVRGLTDGAFEHAVEIEIVPADLCRRELLVEIEGVAWTDRI